MHKIFPFLTELKIPNLFALQSQLAFVQSALYLEIVKKMDLATVYLRPPIDEYGTGDFHSYEDIKVH
jgi:lysophospholipid hydrolase